MARVAYTIAGFREKNNEKVQDKTMRMMRTSSDKTLVTASCEIHELSMIEHFGNRATSDKS